MIGIASAPASSGNLGPGFDILALALELRCTATVEESDEMTITEHGSTRRLGNKDMIAKAVRLAVDRPMHVTLDNQVPRSRGLGSSSAVCASVAAASMKAMHDDGGREKVFRIVDELEGHADNAAAAVFGGLVAATKTGIQQLEMSDTLVPVVGIPDSHLRTKEARRALDPEVPRPIVVRSLARLAFLIEGLRSGEAQVLAQAAGDELHEEPRASLSEITGELMAAARTAGALHACWSGAGPTALALTTNENRGRVIGAMSEVLGTNGEVLTLPVDYEGLR